MMEELLENAEPLPSSSEETGGGEVVGMGVEEGASSREDGVTSRVTVTVCCGGRRVPRRAEREAWSMGEATGVGRDIVGGGVREKEGREGWREGKTLPGV